MTAIGIDHDVDALTRLLQQQAELYGKLAQLSTHQSTLIDSNADDAAEQLLRLMSARQVLVDQLAKINEQLEPYRKDWQAIAAKLTDEQKKTIAPLVEQAEKLLADIIARDEADRKRLQQAKTDTGNQLKRVTGASHAAAAYRKPGGTTNAFTNQSA